MPWCIVHKTTTDLKKKEKKRQTWVWKRGSKPTQRFPHSLSPIHPTLKDWFMVCGKFSLSFPFYNYQSLLVSLMMTFARSLKIFQAALVTLGRWYFYWWHRNSFFFF